MDALQRREEWIGGIVTVVLDWIDSWSVRDEVIDSFIAYLSCYEDAPIVVTSLMERLNLPWHQRQWARPGYTLDDASAREVCRWVLTYRCLRGE